MGEATSAPMQAPQVYFDVASQRLNEQLARIDGLDGKAGAAFGWGSGMLPIVSGLLAARGPSLSFWSLGGLFLAAIAYIVLARAAYSAYQVKDWSYQPDLGVLKENCTDFDESTMKAWVADRCLVAITYNEPLLARKAQHVIAALRALPFEAIFLLLAALASLLP